MALYRTLICPSCNGKPYHYIIPPVKASVFFGFGMGIDMTEQIIYEKCICVLCKGDGVVRADTLYGIRIIYPQGIDTIDGTGD